MFICYELRVNGVGDLGVKAVRALDKIGCLLQNPKSLSLLLLAYKLIHKCISFELQGKQRRSLRCVQEFLHLFLACHYPQIGPQVNMVVWVMVTIQIWDIPKILKNKPD